MSEQLPSAGDILAALRQHDLPVVGFDLPDPYDSSTWEFFGEMTPRQRQQAVIVLDGFFHPVVVETPPTEAEVLQATLDAITKRLEAVEVISSSVVGLQSRIEIVETRVEQAADVVSDLKPAPGKA